MLRSLVIPLLSLLSCWASVASAYPLGHVETDRFAVVREQVDTLVRRHGAERVLVVFDLDNTILATDLDLGSEHWFLWQSGLIAAGPESGAVARSVDELLEVQGWIYALTPMHAVEPRIGPDVAAASAAGVSFMVLTSRSLGVRDATLRELARNGIDPSTRAPGPAGGFAGAYLPYDPKAPERFGLTPEDVERLHLTAPKPVIYEHGVMLTQGQHKGAMLKTLLAKTGASYAAIVFVDDRPHHLEGMQDAFAARDEAVLTVRYVHELPRITAFNSGDKRETTEQWCTLGAALHGALGLAVERCPAR